MGGVWRAQDTTVKRDVAVKALPESFATDSDRLARFRREAEILASLNHPNIATIYGLEQSDDQTVIVMELVTGPTLADRIAEGPIPADEALAIARQVADALEAAHGRQIVHRDLKPANIKLRDDGTVRVLDFGISKPVDATGDFSFGASVELFSEPFWFATDIAAASYDVASDGRFLMIQPLSDSAGSQDSKIVIVQNWFEEVRQLAPVD